MFFSAFVIANNYHLRQMKKFLVTRFHESITTYDPSTGGMLLGNNNKSEECIFIFDEPIFIFQD